jgi:hypothetical protein
MDEYGDPMRLPSYSDPIAHAASSTTIRPWREAISEISRRAQGKPIWWTTKIAFVRGVIELSMRLGSRLKVKGSMSTKMGFAPV